MMIASLTLYESDSVFHSLLLIIIDSGKFSIYNNYDEKFTFRSLSKIGKSIRRNLGWGPL
jgi:hypothetical protein